jgi:hypothetical protein
MTATLSFYGKRRGSMTRTTDINTTATTAFTAADTVCTARTNANKRK